MTATAVEAWDERWTKPEGRADCLVPHSAEVAVLPVLRIRRPAPFLDTCR